MPSEAGADTRLTVERVVTLYLAEHVEEKVVDKGRQGRCIDHVLQHLRDTPIADIDIPFSRRYLKIRRQEGAANSTVRRELNTLIAAANHCRRWRHMSGDQMPMIELPEIPAGEEVKWFSKDQLRTIFSACKEGRLACFIRIAYYTAGRRNSIERLRRTQIDLVQERIHLALPGERVTKKRRPTVPLYPEIRPSVDWLMQHSGTEFLFGTTRNFYRPFSHLCTSLGFYGHPHMLRHSRATHMLHDGESIYKVAKLLGDSVATVERVYGHSSTAFLSTSSGDDLIAAE